MRAKRKARKRDAALLPLRERAHRERLELQYAERIERRSHRIVRRAGSVERSGRVQVLDRREVFLERVGMAAERELGAIFVAERVDRLAVPAHFAALGRARPQRIRSRLVLPLPFAPCTCRHSPGASRNEIPAKRRRVPRRHSRSFASSIGIFQRGPTGAIDAGQSAG
jgi:hypothetical protein